MKNTTINKLGLMLLALIGLLLSISCKENIPRDKTICIPRFSLGQTAYMKPDSLKVIIDDVNDKMDKGYSYGVVWYTKNREPQYDSYVYEYMFY